MQITADELKRYLDNTRIVLQFEAYINSKVIDKELKSMKTTQWYMIDRIREAWSEIKKGGNDEFSIR